jgi:hypothetical protein
MGAEEQALAGRRTGASRIAEKVTLTLVVPTRNEAENVRRVYEELGPQGLKDVAKVHFATTERIFGPDWDEGGER